MKSDEIFLLTLIENYLSEEDLVKIVNISNCDSIIQSLKEYGELHPNYQRKINILIDKIDSLIDHAIDLKEEIEMFLNVEKHKYYLEYLDFLSKLYLVDELEAIFMLKRANIKKNNYEMYLKYFKKRFPLEEEAIVYFKYIYDKYMKYFNIKEKQPTKEELINQQLKNDRINLVLEVLDSHLSKEEFCSKNGIRISSVSKAFERLCISEKNNLKEQIEEFKQKDNTEFMNYLKNIVYEMVKNPDFDMIDYYNYTRLYPDDFVRIVKPLIKNKDINRRFQEKMKSMQKRMYKVKPENVLDTLYITNGYEVKREEKEAVFKYLEENGLTNDLYDIALDKYLKGNLDLFGDKQLVRKDSFA